MISKRKLTLSTLMACLIVGNVGFAEVVDYKYLGTEAQAGIVVADGETKELAEENYKFEINKSGSVYGILSTAKGVANVKGENINIEATSSNAASAVYGVGAAVITSGSKFTHGGTVNLGTDDTENINVTVNSAGNATGITALRSNNNKSAEPAFVNVDGKNLIINVYSEKGYAAGIWVQNNTGDPANPSTVTIDTENTYITSNAGNKQMESGEYYNLGLVNYSSGKLVINSNLTVDAGTALSTRGGAQTYINKDGDKTVKINGDINFNYDEPTSGTAVDATVDINLTNSESYLNGNIFVNGNPFPPEGKDDVSAMNLGLANGAQWSTDASSFVNNLTMNGGIININGDASQTVNLDTVSGNGGTINMKTTLADNGFETANVVLGIDGANDSVKGNMAVNFTGITADDVNDANTAMEQLVSNISVNGTQENFSADANIKEGLLKGAINADIANDGNLVAGSVRQNTSTTTMDNMRDIASVALIAWRQEDGTLSQRLGELRNSEGDQGIWVRMNRGEFEYGGKFKNQYNFFQIGYDKAYGDWHYGAAISHNDGQTTYSDGNGDNSSTSLSLYGTWLGDKGHYADIVLKEGRLSNEFENYAEAGYTKGDYDAWGTSISGEYGRKIDLNDGWFVTPQAQMTYMYITGEDYTTNNGISVSQDSMQSVVGRVGFEIGKNISDNGSIYAKASLLHEFAGDADTYLSMEGISNSYTQDLSDTWYEAGIGFNYKTSANSYVYADVVKTYGGDIETPWQWNAGMRWTF